MEAIDTAAHVLFDRSNGLLDITFNRPDNGNLISNEMGSEIIRALRGAGDDLKLIRLRGKGSDFCKGRQSPSFDRQTAPALKFKALIAEPALELYAALKNAPAPVLGVVQGRAFGVGLALAALCDIAIAAENSVFAVPEMGHGIPPTLVMTALSGRVPYKAIAHLVLSREEIPAAQAERLGIVSKVVPEAELERECELLTERLLAYPAASAQAVKEFLIQGLAMDSRSGSAFAANLIATVLSSKDRT